MNENKASFPRQNNMLNYLQKRSGIYYPLLIVALAQLSAFPLALIGSLLIQMTANYTPEQMAISGTPTIVLILLGNLLLLGVAYYLCRNVINRLNTLKTSGGDSGNELIAWKEVSSFPWKYGSIAIVLAVFIDVIPVATYMFVSNKTSYDQFIYSLLGGFVSVISSILLAIILIEAWFLPIREILLPKDTEKQLSGTGGIWSNLFGKNLVFTVTLIIVSVLLVAPIGYRQTTRVLMEAISSIQVLSDLRSQSILVSIIAILLGAGLVFLLTRSVTRPLEELINTFKKVESGDLSQRARVLATDEVGQLAIYFNRMISRLDEFQQTLEKRVSARTEQLRVSNEVGRIASTILDPDTVMTRVVNLITESFDYYYAAIFLISENERWAELKDATGSAGEILKNRHHKLQLNKTSMVGAAILTREPQVTFDIGENTVRFNNPLLPDSRSEIAIPLIIGDRVIGALDVQSIRGTEFQPDVVSTLQSMANQVAIAIENARLFKEMEQALLELRQTNRQYVVSAWADKNKSTKLQYSSGGDGSASKEETREIDVSLNLREESIGHIKFEPEGEWSSEDQAWVEALATQVAISLENARLVEESQQSALRDRLSASIVQKLWASNSIDSILQTAIRELGHALEASEATIELIVEE